MANFKINLYFRIENFHFKHEISLVQKTMAQLFKANDIVS